MKTFLSILASVLFCSVFFTPTDDEPLSTYFLWSIWCAFVLWIVNIIWKTLEEWRKEDEKN